MDKDTFKASWDLVLGVADMTFDYLFLGNNAGRSKEDLIEAVDDLIRELESWRKQINSSKSGDKNNG